MASTAETLAFEHLKSQTQFAYFQLGLAASAIAFAVHETSGHALRDTPWPIGAAVFIWAISFASGCFGVEAHQRGMRTNFRYLQMPAVHPIHLQDQKIAAAVEAAKVVVENDLNRPGKRFRLQLWFLFAGAMAYVAGHVMQMANLPITAAKSPKASQDHRA